MPNSKVIHKSIVGADERCQADPQARMRQVLRMAAVFLIDLSADV